MGSSAYIFFTARTGLTRGIKPQSSDSLGARSLARYSRACSGLHSGYEGSFSVTCTAREPKGAALGLAGLPGCFFAQKSRSSVLSRSPSNWCPTSHRFFVGLEGSPTRIDYRKKRNGTLILTSLLEDLGRE